MDGKLPLGEYTAGNAASAPYFVVPQADVVSVKPDAKSGFPPHGCKWMTLFCFALIPQGERWLFTNID
jgi:hypothetical protein